MNGGEGWSMKQMNMDYGQETVSIGRNPPYRAVDLNQVEASMLRYNKMLGVLPVVIDELDLDIKLTYRFGSRKPLSERLKLGGISANELFRMLYSIADLLNKCDNYLLDPKGFILREELIFVGASIHDTALLYAPLQMKEDTPLCARFRSLVIFCLGYVSEVQGNRIQECLLYLNESEFSLSGWCERLREWSSQPTQEQGAIAAAFSAFAQETSRDRSSEPNDGAGKHTAPQAFPIVHELWETGPLRTMDDDRDEGSGEIKRIAAALLILSCAIWSLFALQPSWNGAYIASGVQLLLVDLAFLYWKYGGRRLLHSGGKHIHPRPVDPEVSFADYVMSDSIQSKSKSTTDNSYEIQASPSTVIHETVLLRNDQQTELLVHGHDGEPIYPYLEGVIGGIHRQEHIRSTPYVIGRGERCDWILEEQGASRRHLEIDKSIDGYVVKDLGSSNGTMLNGEKMIPYKSYPLGTGDKLRIIGTEWEFRQSGSPLVNSSKVTA
jgi:hypothetical protein